MSHSWRHLLVAGNDSGSSLWAVELDYPDEVKLAFLPRCQRNYQAFPGHLESYMIIPTVSLRSLLAVSSYRSLPNRCENKLTGFLTMPQFKGDEGHSKPTGWTLFKPTFAPYLGYIVQKPLSRACYSPLLCDSPLTSCFRLTTNHITETLARQTYLRYVL